MISLKTITKLTLALTSCVALTTPAMAQYSINGEQPAVGTLHQQEARIQGQLDSSYARGLIDPFELSNLTRDLDAIRVHEEALRMRKQGMTEEGQEKIQKQLDAFQTDLNYRCAEKAAMHVAAR